MSRNPTPEVTRCKAPVPRVIDFGLAKATSACLTEQNLFTALGGVIGTPLYMARAGRNSTPWTWTREPTSTPGGDPLRAVDRHDADHAGVNEEGRAGRVAQADPRPGGASAVEPIEHHRIDSQRGGQPISTATSAMSCRPGGAHGRGFEAQHKALAIRQKRAETQPADTRSLAESATSHLAIGRLHAREKRFAEAFAEEVTAGPLPATSHCRAPHAGHCINCPSIFICVQSVSSADKLFNPMPVGPKRSRQSTAFEVSTIALAFRLASQLADSTI